jgi:membrane-associated phospholipid phosphatase
MLPTAPPRMIEGYVDVLNLHSSQGWWGADASAPRGLGHLTNELAAFPSLHAGWSLWCAIMLQRHARHRIIRIFGWAGAFITAAVVIGTANHWVLDVLVGWMVVLGGVVAVAAFTPRLRVASPVEAPLGTEAVS